MKLVIVYLSRLKNDPFAAKPKSLPTNLDTRWCVKDQRKIKMSSWTSTDINLCTDSEAEKGGKIIFKPYKFPDIIFAVNC